MKILIANVGSTSFKFKLYDMDTETILAQGRIENIGSAGSPCRLYAGDRSVESVREFPRYEDAISECIEFVTAAENGLLAGLSELSAVGFKTVHGKGMSDCRILEKNTLQAMEDYSFLAPAHNPPYIRAIRIFADMVNVPLIGLFEPAFHRSIPDYAYTYGIPGDLARKHSIRKYGFHGASHRYISERAPVFAGKNPGDVRLISCHLGGSSSVCAIKNGKSLDTSMGFSPQSGVLNGKRCGDLDPFIPLFLQKAEDLSVDEVADVLNSRSGLLGISAVSGDAKEIEDAAVKGEEGARLAVESFCYGVKQYIGSYYVTLEGCDLLVFTGGIGEKSAFFREKITSGLFCLGMLLDGERNRSADGETIISRENSPVTVAVVPTNEELVVAREVKKLLQSGR
jgi:acetate kinase